MLLFRLYQHTMTLGKPLIMRVLNRRLREGKEDPARLNERTGIASRPRPDGTLLWLHVASVGEALSMLRLITLFLDQNPDASVLVTAVTRNAATVLEKRLPSRAFHHYLPVDRPKWVKRFLDHWRPDLILWAESELWPTLLGEVADRRIPAALVNARLSPRSFRNWSHAKGTAEKILSAFTVILTQTEDDADRYRALGGRSVVPVGNIKFAAAPLPYEQSDFESLKARFGNRPVWLYASTHDDEETLAAEVHRRLMQEFPTLLTVIAPRHPERRDKILSSLLPSGLTVTRRGETKTLPTSDTQIYLVDTMGELGLFYALIPLSVIGRSFSADGGGGHNPLEAAQLGSAVLHGPAVGNLNDIFVPMDAAGASICVETRENLAPVVGKYLGDPNSLKTLAEKGYDFARGQNRILGNVIEEIEPLFLLSDLPVLKAID